MARVTDQRRLEIEERLRTEPTVWLSSTRPDGRPHVVPVWFNWDGSVFDLFSKPNAQKVRNLRTNPTVMLALGEAEEDFDVGLLEGHAEMLDSPASVVLPAGHLAKYDARMAEIGLSRDEFLATYSQVIRITPTRFLPWHGRTLPVSATTTAPMDRRLAAAIGRVAAGVARSDRRPFAVA